MGSSDRPVDLKSSALGTGAAFSPRIPDDVFFLESLNPEVRAVERIMSEAALTEIPLLLVGESGTGKEMAAIRIHRLSRRREESFVKVTCSMLGVSSLEGPARTDGLGNGAQGWLTAGTVFFDEIGDLDPVCQPKLLHVLPDGEGVPAGCFLRARVICSSSGNLEEKIRSGHFRQELFYRLNGMCLRLPPLRQRKEDILSFIEFFLAKFAKQFERPKPSLSARTLSSLAEYSWPGNIRQLENAVRKIVALRDEKLALADIEPVGLESQVQRSEEEPISLKEAARAASRHAERELILKALERTHWNRKRAAKELQISYKALLYKLKQIGLDDSSETRVSSRQQG